MSMSQAAPTLQQCTQQLSQQLSAICDNPAHEARLLLCHLLSCQPGYLYTYPERVLTPSELQQLQPLLQRRLAGEPLAYIFGHWPFYGLELAVAPCTLIPRSDTEILVEQALALTLPAQARVLDLGTGTGAIALALAHNRPQWQLTGVDLQSEAVALAQRNAQALKLSNVDFTVSSWFSALADQQYDLIVSNPPFFPNHLKSPDPKRNLALHNDTLSFEELASGIISLFHPLSEFWAILPPVQMEELKKLMVSKGLRINTRTIIKDNPTKNILREILGFSFLNQAMYSKDISIKDKNGNYSKDYSELLKEFLIIF